MKTNRYYILLIVLALTLTSCHTENINVSPNDTIVFIDIPVEDYNTMEIANSFDAYVRFSDTEESIRIEANSSLQHLINATIKNNKLTVKLKNNVNIKGSPTLVVYINAASIDNFKVAADSKITLENTLVSNESTINISADSYFTGEVNVDKLNLKAAADARADLYGTVDYLNADLSADVRVSDYDLIVNDLKLKMVADCDTELTVNNSIHIDATADCVLKYKGNAAIIHQHLKADSRIIKMD